MKTLMDVQGTLVDMVVVARDEVSGFSDITELTIDDGNSIRKIPYFGIVNEEDPENFIGHRVSFKDRQSGWILKERHQELSIGDRKLTAAYLPEGHIGFILNKYQYSS